MNDDSNHDIVSTDMDTLYKGEDVAKVLKISRSCAYALMKSGELPTVRFRRLVRVRHQDLIEFINSRLHKGSA